MNYPSGETKQSGVTECILVSYDNSNGLDHSVLIVGRQRKNKPVEIINAFQNEEANDLWERLITKKKQEK